MNIRYLTLIYVVIVCLAVAIMNDIADLTSLFNNRTLQIFVTVVSYLLQLLSIGTLIIALKKHHENIWRILPFYGLIFCKLVVEIKTLFAFSWSGYYVIYGNAAIGLMSAVVYVYMFISAYRTKNPRLAFYLKAYNYSYIAVGISRYAIIQTLSGFTYSTTGRVTNDLILCLPFVVILLMLYELYSRYEKFRINDSIITLKDLENVPTGSMGLVIAKHGSEGYYEIEFFDENNNLLNVLSVASDEIERAPVLTLDAKVENWGVS